MPYKDPDAQRKFQRERLAKRRADWFADKKCIDCGSTENLELDHVDPSTKIHHCIWSWSEVRRTEELAKCVARCHSCHLVKSIGQMEQTMGLKPYRHGTHSMYTRHKCKCGLCRLYNRNNARRKREASLCKQAKQPGLDPGVSEFDSLVEYPTCYT